MFLKITSEDFGIFNVGNKIGIDHCFGPDVAYEDAVKATSITFSNGVSYGGGYDWYSNPIVILRWD